MFTFHCWKTRCVNSLCWRLFFKDTTALFKHNGDETVLHGFDLVFKVNRSCLVRVASKIEMLIWSMDTMRFLESWFMKIEFQYWKRWAVLLAYSIIHVCLFGVGMELSCSLDFDLRHKISLLKVLIKSVCEELDFWQEKDFNRNWDL